MSAPSSDPLVGRLLDGRYQVRARVARGGMATVYVATDLRLDRRVAVKIMHAHLADDESFRDRFIQEARSAARLAHPNVVNVFDQGQDDSLAYLVMEYLQGITLRDLLGEYGRLTADQTMDIVEAVLSGLVAAHKAGIIHRDLKPENVLLADDGRIKIADFGLARAASTHTGTGQALLGTIAYLSPELVTRGIADTRSDIYAVGIMMYEMLVGEQPFRGEQPVQIAYQHANDSVPSPSLKNPDVPPALDDLVLWATARDPEGRPRDARAMLDQLFTTEHLIHDEDGHERTAVLPVAHTRPQTAATRVVTREHHGAERLRERSRDRPPDRERERVADGPPPSTTKLVLASARARRRGAWAACIVLVLAAVAAGTGWFFGHEPGGSGRPTTLTAHSLRSVRVPPVVGLPVPTAAHRLVAIGLVVAAAPAVFSSKVPRGQVLRVQTTAGTVLAPGAALRERTPVRLVPGAGPLPPVRGLTTIAAVSTLASAGVHAVSGPTAASRAVPLGAVIGATHVAGGWHVGDTVPLTISSGPPASD